MIQLRNLCLIPLLIFTFMLIGLAACRDKQRRPDRYLIPNGYVGWVRINYKIKDARTIPVEDGYNLLEFSQNGIINTSSNGETGFAQDEYYYYSDSERRRISDTGENNKIWGRIGYGSRMVPGQVATKYGEFFVGTQEEYEKYGIGNVDPDRNPIIGPIDKPQSNAKEVPSPNTK
jgi:hypothetical protein